MVGGGRRCGSDEWMEATTPVHPLIMSTVEFPVASAGEKLTPPVAMTSWDAYMSGSIEEDMDALTIRTWPAPKCHHRTRENGLLAMDMQRVTRRLRHLT